jgi:hypothetical protein
MTVQKALEALAENYDYIQEVPAVLCQEEPSNALRWLMSKKPEDFQNRANEEWVNLIQEENEPVQGAYLLIDWVNDKAQAWERQRRDEEEASVPE